MDAVKERICSEVDALSETLFSISNYLLENPEIAYEEVKACAHLSDKLEEHGFTVERGAGNVETAFLGRPKGCEPKRPSVAILSEYDALPKIGHGCGHNLIGAAGFGAAVALSRVLGGDAGSIVIVGTPAEEGGGGKVRLVDVGVFNDIDAAMMFHPKDGNFAGRNNLGRIKFSIEFFGKTSHASSTPDQGRNALDALVLAYTGMNSMRQHLKPDGRIHGIITHGGDAPNIIPDYAAGLFYVRAASISYRDELFDQVKRCAEGAALATGTEVKIEISLPSIDPIRRNPALEGTVAKNMELLGLSIDPDDGRRGSSDIGNLSQFIPAIHPYLAICDSDIAGHSVGFREATVTERGKQALVNAAKMLAMTAHDYLSSQELQAKVSEDFKKAE